MWGVHNLERYSIWVCGCVYFKTEEGMEILNTNHTVPQLVKLWYLIEESVEISKKINEETLTLPELRYEWEREYYRNWIKLDINADNSNTSILEKLREFLTKRYTEIKWTAMKSIEYGQWKGIAEALRELNLLTSLENSSKIPNSSTVSKMEIPELPDFEYQCSNEWTNGTPVDEIGKQVEAITKYLKNK